VVNPDVSKFSWNDQGELTIKVGDEVHVAWDSR